MLRFGERKKCHIVIVVTLLLCNTTGFFKFDMLTCPAQEDPLGRAPETQVNNLQIVLVLFS